MKLSRDARDELANEPADFYVEAFGEPWRVCHVDGLQAPHIDVYIYQPGAVLPGWMLVTVGRCTEQVAGQRVELVQHLRPQEDEDAMHEAADVLRSVALLWGRVEPSWTFKPLHDERFVALGKELVYQPTFLLAVFKRGSEAGR